MENTNPETHSDTRFSVCEESEACIWLSCIWKPLCGNRDSRRQKQSCCRIAIRLLPYVV